MPDRRRTPRRWLAPLALAGLTCGTQALAQTVGVDLPESSEAFKNPMKGFRPSRYIQDASFPNHEYAAVYKQYIKYTDLENASSDTAQKIVDWSNRAWAGIEDRNVKVIPRVVIVYPDGPDGGQYWPDGVPHDGSPGQWISAALKARMVAFVAKLGQAWDKDPRVAAVELGLWGKWGEHHIWPDKLPDGTDRIPADFQGALGSAAAKAFPTKKVMVRYPQTFTGAQVGLIWDSFALPDDAANGAAMIARQGWATQMVSGEVAYDWGDQSRLGGSPDGTLASSGNTDYVIDWIRRTNTSSLGWISDYSAGNPAVEANASRMQLALGYDYVLKHASFTAQAQPGGSLQVAFDVANKGSAPFYYRWPVKASLLRADRSVAWSGAFDADIRTWQPGQSYTVSQAFALPAGLAQGVYTLALSVNDPAGDLPSLRFANKNYYKGDWTVVGKAGVGQAPANQGLDRFDLLKGDDSLRYKLVYAADPPAGNGAVVFTGTPAQGVVSGGAVLGPCATCPSGQKVGYIGNGGGTLSFRDIAVDKAGTYAVTVSYLTAEPRSMTVSVNGGAPVSMPFDPTGGWDKVGTKTLALVLRAGINTLTFSSLAAWAPDVAGIVVSGAPAAAAEALVLDSFDKPADWPGRNDLGLWAGASGFANGAGRVAGGALALPYDGNGWFGSDINQDLSRYGRLVLRIKGASGGEGTQFKMRIGGVYKFFSDFTSTRITTSYQDIAIDLNGNGIDKKAPGQLNFEFWWGGSGQVWLDDIHFE